MWDKNEQPLLHRIGENLQKPIQTIIIIVQLLFSLVQYLFIYITLSFVLIYI